MGHAGRLDFGCRGADLTTPGTGGSAENEAALFLPKEAEATRAYQFAKDCFPSSGTPVLVVFQRPEGLEAPAFSAAAELATWLTGPDAPVNVVQVLSPQSTSDRGSGFVSPDGTSMYVFVDVSG